mmetsp:Transcript_10418/g.29713  ORF Transcript_10418/g.29713 Transcript_10418/m.29713 type:complete len:210 (-) Transcript_10418:2315-2944(-)
MTGCSTQSKAGCDILFGAHAGVQAGSDRVRAEGAVRQPKRLHLALPLHVHHIVAWYHPDVAAGNLANRLRDEVGGGGGELDLVLPPSRFHPCGRVDGVTEQLKSRLLSPQHAGRDWAAVNSNSHPQCGCVGSQRDFQLLHELVELGAALLRELDHDGGMVLRGSGQARHGHVTISDSLDLEHLALPGDLVECRVRRLEEGENLRWFSDA